MNALLVSINWLKFHTIMIVLVAIFVYAGIFIIGLEFIGDLYIDHPFIGAFLLLVWFVLLVAPIVFVFSLKA